MDALVIGLVSVCLLSQVITLAIVGRFTLLIEDMHKREYRKNNTKN